MNPNDKATELDLMNRLPEHATLLDLAHELERAARAHPPAPAAGSGWLIGQACRQELHRVSRERALRLGERLMPLFSHGTN